MAIEIVDFPIKNGDFPWQNVSSPEGKYPRTLDLEAQYPHKAGRDNLPYRVVSMGDLQDPKMEVR